ncbi:MAG: hypothetical protein HZA22_11235 [Nitrospirae bacterium]|nr:hypothetical protein [Nitrospirota bacterium]
MRLFALRISMKGLIKAFVFLFLSFASLVLFLFYGRFWTVTDYAYNWPEIKYEWGSAGGHIDSYYHEIDWGYVGSSPYKLSFWVEPKYIHSQEEVTIDNVRLQDLREKKSISFDIKTARIETSIIESGTFKGKKSYYYNFSQELNLDYNEQLLTFDLIITENHKTVKEQVTLKFDKDLEKHRYNKYLETMMSV